MLAAILATVLALLLWRDPALTLHTGAKTLALNLLPPTMLCLGFWGLTRRGLLSLLAGGAMTLVLFYASATKAQYLDTPLLPSDFSLASQLISNPALFSGYLDITPRLLVFSLSALVLLALLWKFEPPTLPRTPRWIRLPLALAALALVVTSLLGAPPTQRLYAGQFGPDAKTVWSPVKFYASSGLVNGLAFFAAQAKQAVGVPDAALLKKFDDKHANDLAARSQLAAPAVKPDIFIIQSESLFDPQTIVGMDTQVLMPNWHRLAARGIHGGLVSPAFGGITIRAEFEVLTGYPMRAFPTVQYPYYGLVRSGINSLPQDLDGMGYTTTVAHPHKAGFWNRKTVMQRLGFQQLLFDDNDALRDLRIRGRYPADDAFFDHLLALPVGRQPQFVFGITMENHGPWGKQRVPEDSEALRIPLPPGLKPQGTKELQAYLWHVIEGDRALGAFADALLKRPRPTYLVVYGDHLPALKKTYKDIDFVNGQEAHAQDVPFFIVSNQSLSPRQIDGLRMNYLPALLLETAGLPQPGYFAIDGLLADSVITADKGLDTETVLRNAVWRDYRNRTASH